jgi:hypothetical protein
MWSFDRLKIEVIFIIGGKWVVQAEATDRLGALLRWKTRRGKPDTRLQQADGAQ